MRRALPAALMVALTAAAPAAAAPQGAPRQLRAAGLADTRARPGELSEWWVLRAIDPRSERSLLLEVIRDDNSPRLRVVADGAPTPSVDATYYVKHLHAGIGRLNAGVAGASLTVRGSRLHVASAEATGTLRLRHRHPGPAGIGWRLGTAVRYPSGRRKPVTLNWSMPVATSRVRGSLLLPGGRRLNMNGWRASYERGWGDVLLSDRAWDFSDEVVIHDTGGRAWVAYGLNRTDTVTGPGAREAQWLGLLARVDRRGVRICRPRIVRRGWQLDYPDFARWPTRLRLSCGGMSLRVRERLVAVDDFPDYTQVRDRTIAGRRHPGLVVHLTHPLR